MLRFALLEKSTNRILPAFVREPLCFTDLQQARSAWEKFKTKMSGAVEISDQAQHSHWDWTEKYVTIQEPMSFLGLECQNEVQGLMAIRTAPRSSRLPGGVGRLLYLEYLEAAPWNLLQSSAPRFGGVGTALIAAAIEASLRSGCQGAIGLHSLSQAEPFYRRTFTDLGLDKKQQNLRYFEMSAEQAGRFLEGVRHV